MAKATSLKFDIHWALGHSPVEITNRVEGFYGEHLPMAINRVMELVAGDVKQKLQSIHSTEFSIRSSGISYDSIQSLRSKREIDIIPGKVFQGYSYKIGYFPGFIEGAKQLAPRHQVQDYMQYLNKGVKPGKIIAPVKGGSLGVSMSPAGWERLREWADRMGIAQGTKEMNVEGNYNISRLPYKLGQRRKRSGGLVGRPRNYRINVGPQQQLWAIVKHMEKKGIRGRHHLFKFASYLSGGVNEGIGRDVHYAMVKAKNEFVAKSGVFGSPISLLGVSKR